VKSPKNGAIERTFGRLNAVVGIDAIHVCVMNVCELREDARI
jgi:hypothetical protein